MQQHVNFHWEMKIDSSQRSTKEANKANNTMRTATLLGRKKYREERLKGNQEITELFIMKQGRKAVTRERLISPALNR